MEILFVHPNFPGQFRRLAGALLKQGEHSIHALGDASWMATTTPLEGIVPLAYPAPEAAGDTTHPYARSFDAAVKRGQQAIQTLLHHKRQGLEPDVIFTHPGWGDGYFLKDVFPGTPVIGLFEYYYRVRGADVGFDPEFPMNFDDIFRIRSLNAVQLLALESCDQGFCPTHWQRDCFPASYRDRLSVIHDGIDTTLVCPDPEARYTLADGTVLTANDEIVTYVSRNLEPYRGYHIFMRALPHILEARPHCRVLIVGACGVSYGKQAPPGTTWQQHYLNEVADRIDLSRVHFTGPLPYAEYLKVLQISSAHIYLTYPFILSWSMLEAMSAGCLLIASATPPVEEVARHGENALLFPFRDHAALAKTVITALSDQDSLKKLRTSARQTIIDRYDFDTVSLPTFKNMLNSIV